MKLFKAISITIALILLLLAITTYVFMQQKVFGKNPTGERLKNIENSVHYKEGAFQNQNPTEVILKDASFFSMMVDFFNKPKTVTPAQAIPSVKIDLKDLMAPKPTIVWFGHSSYLIKSKDVTILVDPVFSGYASPVSFFGKSFEGTDVYGLDDLPAIDWIILTHDHYDHLDYQSILYFKNRVQGYLTPLGVGSHLEHWGVAPGKIIEMDWWESKSPMDQIELIATPARHFSGRGFQRGKTFWASFVLKLHGYNILIGGDSGYDSHFIEIGNKYGPFDLAVLEAGQYGKDWPFIHMFPQETVQAAKDLQAKVLFPVHWGKFSLSHHDWKEPASKVVEYAEKINLKVTTPKIGEPIIIDSLYRYERWWHNE